jgi:hypothetical protein
MRGRRTPVVTLVALLAAVIIIPRPVFTGASAGASSLDVVLSEIARMGTKAFAADEWSELHNPDAYRSSDHDPVVVGLRLGEETLHRTHLPLVMNPSTIDLVVTARGETGGYPSTYYLDGYVRNHLTTGPPYSVAVEVDVTFYPYEPPLQPSWRAWVPVRHLFTATMPGEINPFRYSLLLGKASARIGQVRVAAATPIDESQGSYHSLTVTGWAYEDPVVTGAVRNESSHFLNDVKVAVVNPDGCRWREASLDTTALAPGQETGFRVDYYPSGCVDGSLRIVGQGAAKP